MRIDTLITNITQNFPDVPLFGQTLKEEDVLSNKSLLFYRDSNEYRPGANGRGLYCNLYVSYMTRESLELDIPALIEACETGTGLTFTGSSEETGKVIDTDEDALAVTLTFSYPVKVCR